MTVHLVLTFLGLLCLLRLSLVRLHFAFPVKKANDSWGLWLMAVFLLPLVFVPTLPITHFLFVISATWWLWIYALIAGSILLIIAKTLAIAQSAQTAAFTSSPSSGQTLKVKLQHVLLWILWLLHGFWWLLALMLSEYEPGVRTPTLRDSVIYYIDLLSIHAALLILVVLAKLQHRNSWRMRFLWGIWILAYAGLTLGGLL